MLKDAEREIRFGHLILDNIDALVKSCSNNMCHQCKYWKRKSSKYGDCLNTNMQFSFIPYTLWPDPNLGFMFKGTRDQFNSRQLRNLIPLTSHDYLCQWYTPKGIT